jgi:hypothetical protein
MKSYLKDSQNLLQVFNNFIINRRSVYLYSIDFDSLYTNIDKNVDKIFFNYRLY